MSGIHHVFDQIRRSGILDLHYVITICMDIDTAVTEYAADVLGINSGKAIRQFLARLSKMKFIHDMERTLVEEILHYDSMLRDKAVGELSWAVRRIKRIISKRYMENLSLHKLAEETYLSVTYMAMVFKKETGQTINDYLLDVRINHARQLLRDPSLRILDVARAVGIPDPRYFSQVFKKYMGKSPTQYRRYV